MFFHVEQYKVKTRRCQCRTKIRPGFHIKFIAGKIRLVSLSHTVAYFYNFRTMCKYFHKRYSTQSLSGLLKLIISTALLRKWTLSWTNSIHSKCSHYRFFYFPHNFKHIKLFFFPFEGYRPTFCMHTTFPSVCY
jgi:hypothetical protein